jgi:hypothetical protein
VSAVGFDNTFLSILLNPKARIPEDPATGQPLSAAKQRAEFLVAKLSKARQKVILPAPAVSELLTAIGPTSQEYLSIISRRRMFSVAAFDMLAAVELAVLNREIFLEQDVKNNAEPYQKVKFDRQILAILRVCNADTIYTDDVGLAKRAKLCGITPVSTSSLPIPDDEKQLQIVFEQHDTLPEVQDGEET